MQIKGLIRWAGIGALALFAAVAAADNAANGKKPDEVVRETTERVTASIAEARGYIDDNPERFYDEIDSIMSEVVDFRSFARHVMGRFGSQAYYRSLDSEEERAEFRERVKRFAENFREGLIQTYARGLFALEGQRIEVVPLPEDADLSGAVRVEQRIHGEGPQPYVVHYTMRQDSEGKWMLRNVVIEGINLGRTYQSQFASAMRQHDGDIDKVIDEWSVRPAALEDAVGEEEAAQ